MRAHQEFIKISLREKEREIIERVRERKRERDHREI